MPPSSQQRIEMLEREKHLLTIECAQNADHLATLKRTESCALAQVRLSQKREDQLDRELSQTLMSQYAEKQALKTGARAESKRRG